MRNPVKMRKRNLKDLFFVIRLIKASFPNWYRRIPYILFTTFIAEYNGGLAGLIIVPIRKKKGKIGVIAVSKQYQNLDIATALLNEALHFLKKRNAFCCLAKVRLGNKPALDLFIKVGFQVYNLQHRPLLGDVYLMRRYL